MKTIYLTMAAVSALSVAAPVAAQSWNGNRSNVAQLQMQIDAGIEHGTISRREATPLRNSLRQLIGMERQYSPRGFSVRERNALQRRSATLRGQIAFAEQSDNGRFDRDRRADWNDRNDRFSDNDRSNRSNGKDGFAENDRSDRWHRGDRFAGDLRVGQHVSDRQVALPMEYRARYRDSSASYYRYDEDRIYQVDRVTGLILQMIDIPS